MKRKKAPAALPTRARVVVLAEAVHEALDAACADPRLHEALTRVGDLGGVDPAWLIGQLHKRLDAMAQEAFTDFQKKAVLHRPRTCDRGHRIPPSDGAKPREVCPHPDCWAAYRRDQVAVFEARRRRQGWKKTRKGWVPPAEGESK